MGSSGKSGSGLKRQLLKSPTGIHGLDEVMGGGLPVGRPTLVCGGAGSGKTLMATEFIFRGIVDCHENGVFMTFEESKEELYDNVASLGFDLDTLEKEKRFYFEELQTQGQDVVEVGDYELGGLFARMGHAVDTVGAKRIVIDGIESLFSHFGSEKIVRKELRRLFQWLKGKGLTAVITCERGDGIRNVTRHGIEEYVSDCVILLDQRLEDQIATRRLHIIKYRGSSHGTNEYPFLITDRGISVIPITSVTLAHEASTKRVSTGIKELDEMFGGQGYYKGSSVLITGTAGTGKSSLAACFAKSVCENGGHCIYFAFEESAGQIVRNMNSINVSLQPYMDQGLLRIHATRPTFQGLERHLLTMHNVIQEETPSAVIFDPISNFGALGHLLDIKLLFMQLLDSLKTKDITALLTSLTPGGSYEEATEVGISSLMDTWILLQHRQKDGQRERSSYIAKARGIGHSSQVHPFEITSDGVDIKATS